MNKYIILVFLLGVFGIALNAQSTFPSNGPEDERNSTYAIINATLHPTAGQTIENGKLLFKAGKILAVGANVSIPVEAIILDAKGKHIYPAFIEPYADYGVEIGKKPTPSRMPQYERKGAGPLAWNAAVTPEVDAALLFKTDAQKADIFRKTGFATALTHQHDGIVRGTGLLVHLSNDKENEVVIASQAANFFSFNKGTSPMQYPSSLMGSIALLRQTWYDSEWYAGLKEKKELNLSLEAFQQNLKYIQLFEAADEHDILRIHNLSKEFKTPFIVKASGREYRRLDEIKSTNQALLVPVNFQEPYDLSDFYTASQISLEDLRHWETAPFNPYLLHQAGIKFAFTSNGLKKAGDFLAQVKKAVDSGLPAQAALASLTSIPSELLGIDKMIGTLTKDKFASFIISSDTLFADDFHIAETWVNGKRHIYQDITQTAIHGKYKLNIETLPELELHIIQKQNGIEAFVKLDTTQVKLKINRNDLQISINGKADKVGIKEEIRMGGNILSLDGKTSMRGTAVYKDKNLNWKAVYLGEPDLPKAKKDSLKQLTKAEDIRITYPNNAFGFEQLPEQKNYLIKNVTVWTCEQDGKLENQDVLIANGKIIAIGKISDPVKLVKGPIEPIDGTGKHLTPGIIDEHSHIAISRGVNEGAQSNTAEVRIGDVVSPDDINIYRQLSGGTTSAQLLHGSANSIGGQSAVVKLRWGFAAEAMKNQNAPGHIKFALGENVKQSNWGDVYSERFPQTRMGVEQVFMDAFLRAKAYQKEWDDWNKTKNKKGINPPRRDLELEALVEIMEEKRFITCHSYVQSEINMLMHVADSLGFKVNTFTHILEGYKLADKMAKHGAAGSTFADWWAYKMEVNDAIPFNAAIMSKMQVNTSINSDDAEMGRRLNQEAAKVVRYGNVSEEEALKLVTINPAKMLKIDASTGSIKTGKDADVVLWSDNPLSIYAVAEKTWVDGMLLFDRSQQDSIIAAAAREKQAIIQRMLSEASKGKSTVKYQPKKPRLYHCEDLGEEEFEEEGYGH
jgi:imidazolonepropionase-like amidohydrolase